MSYCIKARSIAYRLLRGRTMKPSLYLLIPALFLVSCDQQEVDASRLVTRNDNTRFSGSVSGQDFEETKRLAEQGDPIAQRNLGLLYEAGEGVLENDAEALRWYMLAAVQGRASAQYNLGIMYDNGEGVPQNNLRAYMWWSVAAAQGIEDAREGRDIIADELTPEQLARGQDMAARCFESDFQDCE